MEFVLRNPLNISSALDPGKPVLCTWRLSLGFVKWFHCQNLKQFHVLKNIVSSFKSQLLGTESTKIKNNLKETYILKIIWILKKFFLYIRSFEKCTSVESFVKIFLIKFLCEDSSRSLKMNFKVILFQSVYFFKGHHLFHILGYTFKDKKNIKYYDLQLCKTLRIE